MHTYMEETCPRATAPSATHTASLATLKTETMMNTDAEHRETARALEIILSLIRLDNETARILKSHLTTQRGMFNDRPQEKRL